MDDNRRNFERYGSEQIFWFRDLDDPKAEYQPFVIENISAGGISCQVNHALEKGRRLLLNFELPQITDLIDAIAEVKHVEHLGDNNYRVGVAFLEVKGVPRDLLTDYLEELFK